MDKSDRGRRGSSTRTTGFFSWFQLAERSFFEESLKLALVLFDDVTIQSPAAEIVTEGFPAMFAKLGVATRTAEDVCAHVHPIQDSIAEYKFADPSVWVQEHRLSEATAAALTRFFDENEGPWPNTWALNREVSLVGSGVIDALNLVARLSSTQECFMVPTSFEQRVLKEIIGQGDPRNAFELFREVAQYRLPRFKTISWERVLELRDHRFAADFRKTLAVIQSELRQAHGSAVNELFVEIERKHLKELLRLLAPSPITSTIKGIVTNVPLPIPVNPVGIVEAIRTARKDLHVASTFGWLYFMYELDE